MFCGLFSSPEYAQLCVFGSMCVNPTTACCCSVGFCIVLCVVSALNSWTVQTWSDTCISTAKYECSLFFLEAVLKLFSLRTKIKWEKNWCRKCQSSQGINVPVEIQIWTHHSGVLFPNLLHGVTNGYRNIDKKHCPWSANILTFLKNIFKKKIIKCLFICIWV